MQSVKIVGNGFELKEMLCGVVCNDTLRWISQWAACFHSELQPQDGWVGSVLSLHLGSWVWSGEGVHAQSRALPRLPMADLFFFCKNNHTSWGFQLGVICSYLLFCCHLEISCCNSEYRQSNVNMIIMYSTVLLWKINDFVLVSFKRWAELRLSHPCRSGPLSSNLQQQQLHDELLVVQGCYYSFLRAWGSSHGRV